MNARLLLLPLALVASACKGPAASAPRDAPKPALVVEPAHAPEAPASVARSVESVVTPPTPAEVPRDLGVHVEPGRAGLLVRVDRPGFLVSLRRERGRAVSAGSARLEVAATGTGTTLIRWETTKLATLETSSGSIRAELGKDPEVHVDDAPPRTVAEESKRGHLCRAHRAHDDGRPTGFAVVCRTGAVLQAVNVASDTPDEGVTVVRREGTFVRMDVEPQLGHPAAFVVAYTDRNERVVIRAEASILPGEPEPVLALVSAEREQPIAVFARPMRMPQRFREEIGDISF